MYAETKRKLLQLIEENEVAYRASIGKVEQYKISPIDTETKKETEIIVQSTNNQFCEIFVDNYQYATSINDSIDVWNILFAMEKKYNRQDNIAALDARDKILSAKLDRLLKNKKR